MTSEVISLAAEKLRATTVRVRPELLREARYLLDEEGKSLQEFLAEQLEQYVQRRKQEKVAMASLSSCAPYGLEQYVQRRKQEKSSTGHTVPKAPTDIAELLAAGASPSCAAHDPRPLGEEEYADA